MITTITPTEISHTVFPTMKASWQQAESNTKGLTTTNLNNIKLTNIKLGGIISSGKLWWVKTNMLVSNMKLSKDSWLPNNNPCNPLRSLIPNVLNIKTLNANKTPTQF